MFPQDVIQRLGTMFESLPALEKQILLYVGVAAALGVTVAVAILARYWLRRSLRPKVPPHVYVGIEKVVVYGIILIGVVAALSPFGIQLTGLLMVGGFASLVIGFAAQTVFANFFSGLLLYVERPFKIGDPIKVLDYVGRVEDISMVSTKIRTWDGVLVRIPNEKLMNSDISNYSKSVARRVDIPIGISYKSDIEKAREALRRMLEEHPLVLVYPPPKVYVVDYSDSAIVLKLRCWVPTSMWFETYMELVAKVKATLDEAGIEIPFPQLDLHVKEPVAIDLLSKERQEALSDAGT